MRPERSRMVTPLTSRVTMFSFMKRSEVGREEVYARNGRLEREFSEQTFLTCKYFLCGKHGIAVDRNRVFDVARISAGVSHHHRNSARLGHFEDQQVTLL